MMPKAVLTFCLSVACLVAFSVAQTPQVRVEDYPLSSASAVNCDTIVETHTFSGTCCALNATAGNGCVLNVVNGQCVIKGQYFTVDFTSTANDPCPPGEYTSADLGIEGPPTMSPVDDGSISVSMTSGLLSSLVALFGLYAFLAM